MTLSTKWAWALSVERSAALTHPSKMSPFPRFAFRVLVYLALSLGGHAACGGRAVTDDHDGATGGSSDTGGTSVSTGGQGTSSGGTSSGGVSSGGTGGFAPSDEEVCYDSLNIGILLNGELLGAKEITKICNSCAHAIIECSAVGSSCWGGDCFFNDEGIVECFCTEGAYCIEESIPERFPNGGDCPYQPGMGGSN